MAKDAVSRKISKLVDEGKSQDQAVAIAKSMERRGELGSYPKSKKKKQSSPSKHPEKAVTPMAHTVNHKEVETKRMKRPPYDHERGN